MEFMQALDEVGGRTSLGGIDGVDSLRGCVGVAGCAMTLLLCAGQNRRRVDVPPQLGVVGLRAGASFPPEKFGLVRNPEGPLRALSGSLPRPSAEHKGASADRGDWESSPRLQLVEVRYCILRRLALSCQDVSQGLIPDS